MSAAPMGPAFCISCWFRTNSRPDSAITEPTPALRHYQTDLPSRAAMNNARLGGRQRALTDTSPPRQRVKSRARHREKHKGKDAMRHLIWLTALLLPVSAAAFTARNGMTATQVGPTEIAVAVDLRRSETDYWCAAGDYAERVLNQPGKTRIWRASPKPRRAGEGITFTLDAAHKAEGAGLSHFGSGPRDGSVSVAMATGYCRNIILFWGD